MEVQRIQGNKNILEKEKQSWRTQHLLISKLTAAAAAAAAKLLQSCLTLRDPIDGSPPGPSVPGILQGGVLESVAISFSIMES